MLLDDPEVQVTDVPSPAKTKVGGTLTGARDVPLPDHLDHLDLQTGRNELSPPLAPSRPPAAE